MKKRAMAPFALVFVTICGCSQALSQSRCSLTETNSPSVRGLRLGMSTEQLLALFPGSTKKWAKEPKDMRETREKARAANNSEPWYLGFDPANDAAKEQFDGVDSVSVALYKGRVMDLNVVYGGTTWRNIDEWVAKLSETFKLPGTQDWAVGPSENPNKVLKCDGIEIEAALQGGGSSIRIRSTEYLRAIQERTNGGENKRREFKP